MVVSFTDESGKIRRRVDFRLKIEKASHRTSVNTFFAALHKTYSTGFSNAVKRFLLRRNNYFSFRHGSPNAHLCNRV
jgi:hypothetical protein